MEEKERYEVKRLDYSLNVKLTDNYEPDFRYIIFDGVSDSELAKLETVCNFLNQQDKENQELKQQLKEYSELGTPKEIDDTYRSRNILNYNLQDADRIIDDLVKQLRDLPKKIVCEISESIERLSWRKRIYTNWEFDKEQLYKDLDTILKKFGGENESKGDVEE